jgi:2-polyprenyl-3-methyl-5-hydroxy-6-metoxy-1,4-benzoquinol methylase/glycosyltransferase involved in cell wall biosynthesis
MTSPVDWIRIGSLADYHRYLASEAGTLRSRREAERGLASTGEPFTVRARCWVCQRDVDLLVGFEWAQEVDGVLVPNWREHLICVSCGLNNRMRATLQFLAERSAPPPDARIYATEQTTALYRALEATYPGVVGSEYLGSGIPLGEHSPAGLRNEDVTRLSFPSGWFDQVVSLDVLEHVPDYASALAEFRRVLRPGGKLVLSVPFDPERQEHLVRAVLGADGEVRHLLPPEYHGDPLNPEGCLAYYRFGWQLLSDLRDAGFASADAYTFWSDTHGYLGGPLFFFLATVESVSTEAADDPSTERFVPGEGGPGIALEHLHRYQLASTLARGRVLDLGCGAGYGARLLSTAGASVVTAIDVAIPTIAEARRRFGAVELTHAVGDARGLPFPAGCFDCVVCFELIEHVAEIEQVLAEITRVLTPDGMLILSTPNRPVYSEARDYHNPFHVRELDEGELRALLAPAFAEVELFGQQLVAGSLTRRVGPSAVVPELLSSHDLELGTGVSPDQAPTYFLAVCRRSAVERPVHGASFLAGRLEAFLEEHRERWLAAEANARNEYEAVIARLVGQLREFDARIRQLGSEVEFRQQRVSELSQALSTPQSPIDVGVYERELALARDRSLAVEAEAQRLLALGEARDAEVQGRDVRIQELEKRARALAERVTSLRREVSFLETQLAQLRARERAQARQVAELERVRADLHWSYHKWQEREAQLGAIHRSKTWRLWMTYLAVRRAAGGWVASPLAGVRNALRHVGGATTAAGRSVTRGLGWSFLLFWSAGAWAAGAWRAAAAGSAADGAADRPAPRASRPRLLVVCPYSLHPADHGGAIRIYNLLRRLSTSCDLQLLLFIQGDDDPEQRKVLAPLVEKLYFHHWRPTFKPDRWGLKPSGVQLFEAAEVRERINQILAGERIDILQLEYTELGQYGMPRFARVKVVLTEIDIAFRSLARRRHAGLHRRYPWGRAFGHSLGDCLRQFRYELQVARRADQVHVMSASDAAYLRRFLPDGADKVCVVPNAVDLDLHSPPAPGTRGRQLLFLGNFQHLPNLDALDFLIEEVWPLVRREVPDATLRVVGARAGEEVHRRHGKDGVEVVGTVADTRRYYRECRALVAPIRAGSGTRLKILEALACGAPVVTTTIGAEGIEGEAGEHFLAADTAGTLAAAIVQVLLDDELCARLGSNGRRLVEQRYGWEQSAAAARRGYDRLLAPPPEGHPTQPTGSARPAGAPSSGQVEVSVIVPTLHGGADLERCLAAVRSQETSHTVEVLCVDSGSGPADLDTMRRHGARLIPVERSQFDHGLTRDLGARESQGAVLVFLNQDAVPCDRLWLDRLTAPLFEGGGHTAAVQGAILEVPERERRFYWDSCGGRFYFTRESRRWVERYFGIGFSTVNAAIRRDVWERHPFGRAPIMEDKKWQRAVVEAGYVIAVAPQAAVHHTHDYSLRTLLRRCYSEGVGWRMVGELYSVRDLLADLWQPRMAADLWRGLRRHEVRSWAEVLFPVLRPLMVFRGNRWGQSVRL